MRLRWTPRAIADLEEISDYLVAVRPEAWERLLGRVEHLADVLVDFPLMGKLGLVPGTREFVLAGTPYILVFQVKGDAGVIISVRDGRMRFPSGT
jgi:toxin ParE1/3/4